MLQKYWLSLLLLLIVPGVLFAQSGKIHGSIVDSKTKEPLIGANVVVEGTNFGAATNIDGQFLIINVPVGSHTLKATYIGYRAITMTNIRVTQNYTTEANFELPSEDVQVQTVEIVAERPLVNKDFTNTIQIKTADDIQVLPVRGVSSIVALQASVVKNEGSNVLYIRGGRAEEVNVVIDGVSVLNPLNGQASAAFTNLNQNSIEELQVQTGGFNAEYGSTMSGQINVTTKQATTKYTFGGEAITDGFVKPEVGKDGGWGYNVYNVALGGPLIPGNDLLSFFVAAERQYLGDNDPRSVGGYKPNNTQQSWNYNTKITFRPTKTIDIKVGGMAYLRNGNTWDNVRRQLNAGHMEKFDNGTYSGFLRYTQNFGTNLFITAQAGYFREDINRGDPVWWDNFEGMGDTSQNKYLAAPGVNIASQYSVVQSPNAAYNLFVKSKSENYSFSGDVNLQAGAHLLKAGGEYRTYNIRRYAINPLTLAVQAPGANFPQWTRYRNVGVEYYGYTFDGKSESDGNDWFGNRTEGPKDPLYMAGYIQDKVEISDLVLNFGLRVDYFNANEKVVKDPINPFGARGTPGGGVFDPSDLVASEGFTSVSPRLGFSFPVTDRAVFHAQYGTFLQMPPLQNVLISKTVEEYYMAESPNSYQIPNPNLKPERTVSYEVGYRQLVSENAAISFTGFYKEIKDLIQARNIGSSTSPAYPNSYETFENVDFGTVKGFDLIIELRRSYGFAAQLNYTLSYANGTGTDPLQQNRISWLQSESPKMITPLDYDRRHNGSLNVDYRLNANEGPSIGGIYPLEKTGINLLMTFNSGVPYTQSTVYNPFFGGLTEIRPTASINGATGPWNYRLDLRIDRSFKVGPVGLTASLYIINVTNAQNEFTVYRATGEGDNNGWLATQDGKDYVRQYGAQALALYQDREHNPNNYGLPRQIRLGLRVEY